MKKPASDTMWGRFLRVVGTRGKDGWWYEYGVDHYRAGHCGNCDKIKEL